MVDIEAIKQRIEEIQRRRSLLDDFVSMSYDEFSQDVNIYEAACRHLQVAVQACLDIAKQIIASNGFDRPEELKESFSILAKKNVITNDLAARLKDATGVRNILVHSYLDVDLNEIHKILKNDLKDFDDYVVQIGTYISNLK